MNLVGAFPHRLRWAVAVVLVAWAPSPGQTWELDCKARTCRVLGVAEVAHDAFERIALEVTKQGDIVVTALCPRARHRQFFRTNPRTFMRIAGKDFVPDASYFDDSLPVSLAVDGAARWTLQSLNEAQFKASSRDAETIVETLARGDTATVTYAAAFWGEGQTARIPLEDFKKVVAALEIERPKSALEERAAMDPVLVVQRLIGKNEFGVAAEDLRSKPNTQGEGHFVYVSDKRFQDAEQEFLWFVNEGMAVNLTEATHTLTPALKHPREASHNFWKDTGLSDATVRLEGLRTAFAE